MSARRVTWPDVGLAAVLAYVAVAGTGPAAVNQGQSAPLPSYLLAVAACLSIVAWRWRPAWTFAVAGAAAVAYIALGYAHGPIFFALVFAIYGLTSRSPVRTSVASVAVLLVAGEAAAGVGVVTGTRELLDLLMPATWVIVPAAVGIVVKVRREAAADVRAAQARRAVSEERLQLAQEMHDVVGHGLAVIAMQAGVALRVLEREPAKARTSLEAIRDTSKDALEELRAELEALRNGEGGGRAPRQPHAGLGDLDRLAERIRSSGLPVTLDTKESSAGIPMEVDRAAYRIVQEALTNVLRHAGPDATARVRIAKNAGALEVEIIDSGSGTAAPRPGGHGIAGMRERAADLGGTLEAGPRPSGGFAVRARLPIPDSPQPTEGLP